MDLFCKSAFQISLGLGIPGLLSAPLQNQTQTGHGALPAPGASLPELCVSPKQSIPRICASPVSILSPQRLHTAPSAPHPGCGAVLGVSPSQHCHQSEITAAFSETLALPSLRVQPTISISHGVHCVTDKERILVPGISKLDM